MRDRDLLIIRMHKTSRYNCSFVCVTVLSNYALRMSRMRSIQPVVAARVYTYLYTLVAADFVAVVLRGISAD